MDADIVTNLYQQIETNQRSITARELLLEQWILSGDHAMASGVACDILDLDPGNRAAQSYLDETINQHGQPGPPPAPEPPARQPPAGARRTMLLPPPVALPQSAAERAALEAQLTDAYAELRSRAAMLLDEAEAMRRAAAGAGAGASTPGSDERLDDLCAIQRGRISHVVQHMTPRAVRDLARELVANSSSAQRLIIDDFTSVAEWVSMRPGAAGAGTTTTKDEVRTRIVRRKEALEAALPESIAGEVSTAFMHVEHEVAALGRSYVNDETMTGMEPVADIPRANFFASEDGYAWDMEELAAALAANSGVMRNPLSRQLFGVDDVRRILAHPLGARLRAQHDEQGRSRSGVGAAAIARIASTGRALLDDQSDDAASSREAIDEFLTFAATLPQAEQRVLRVLRIPAVDSYSRQPFDYTIEQSVADAKANKTCYHKVGDFLTQAATFLRRQ